MAASSSQAHPLLGTGGAQPHRLVDLAVETQWPDGVWYSGTVIEYMPTRSHGRARKCPFHIKYLDGDSEWCSFSEDLLTSVLGTGPGANLSSAVRWPGGTPSNINLAPAAAVLPASSVKMAPRPLPSQSRKASRMSQSEAPDSGGGAVAAPRRAAAAAVVAPPAATRPATSTHLAARSTAAAAAVAAAVKKPVGPGTVVVAPPSVGAGLVAAPAAAAADAAAATAAAAAAAVAGAVTALKPAEAESNKRKREGGISVAELKKEVERERCRAVAAEARAAAAEGKLKALTDLVTSWT